MININKNIIEEFIKIHGNKYNYNLFEYKNSYTKTIIICPIHGEFKQLKNSHLLGYGCKECSYDKKRMSLQEFIIKAEKKHGKRYLYTKVNYINNCSKIEILCPIHGSFFQMVNDHLNGKGCKKCKKSKGENKIEKYLIENNIFYETEKIFNGCLNKNNLKFDFYLPEKNMCIEYDGEQHFYPIKFSNKYTIDQVEKRLEDTKFNDEIKNKWCLNNNIRLLRITFLDFKNIETILKDLLK